MTINSKAYADHTAFDKKAKYYDSKSKKNKPTWLMVDVKYKRKLKRAITLTELKGYKQLNDMRVVQRGNRLSITEVSKKNWDFILKLE
jgi:predicted RNA-binding protein with PUA-like domain